MESMGSMGSWFKKHWVTLTAVAMALILGAGVWMYQTMYDLSAIQALGRCQCEGYMLEHEIAHAASIYRGNISKISKSFNGDYTVTVRPEATLKGSPITSSQLKVKVSGDCPYPFQKHQSYVFVLSESHDSSNDSQLISQCNVIISTADVETINTIRQWLRVDDDERDETQADPSDTLGREEDDGLARLFKAISSHESSIRIEEEGFKTWLYDGEEEMFFYSPDVKISLFIPLERQVSREDYDEFVKHITVESAVSGKKIPYVLGDVNIEVTELPIVLKLYNAPQEDIEIRFQSPVGGDSFTIPIRYTEPFHFTVSSESDPQISKYFAKLQEGFYLTNYVESGRTYEYVIKFNQPVDRSSVYEKLYENLRYSTISWSLRWISDYEVHLSFDFDEESTDAVIFSLHGVTNEVGYRLMSREMFTIQAVQPSIFAAIETKTHSQETYFTTVTPFSMIDVSPDGRWILTGIEAHDGNRAVYEYDIRDRFGNIKKSYPIGTMVDPFWVNGAEPSLIYANGNQILEYETGSGETRFIWQLPEERQDGKLISLDYSEKVGKLAAGVKYTSENGQTSYDLFIFDGLQDQTPQRIAEFGSYECLEGNCSAPRIQFTSANGILYTSWERAGDDMEGYIPILLHLDLETMESRTIRPAGRMRASETIMYPLRDGNILQITDLSSAALESAINRVGEEKWVIYDPLEGKHRELFETRLSLFQQSWLQQMVPYRSEQLLLQIYDNGWYLLDLNSKQLKPFSDIHKHVSAIDVEMDRIWFMESGVNP